MLSSLRAPLTHQIEAHVNRAFGLTDDELAVVNSVTGA